MPINYDIVDSGTVYSEEEKSRQCPTRLRVAYERTLRSSVRPYKKLLDDIREDLVYQYELGISIYRDLIRDPAFARINRGGILPRCTQWILYSDIIDMDNRFAFPLLFFTDKNGDHVKKNASCWKLGNVRYAWWTRRTKTRNNKLRPGWKTHKRLRSQGRMAKEMPDPRNSKASYFSYDEKDELVRHRDCEFCHGKLEYDKRMFLYCTSCNLIFE